MSSRRAKQQKKNAEKRRLQHQQVRDAKERLAAPLPSPPCTAPPPLGAPRVPQRPAAAAHLPLPLLLRPAADRPIAKSAISTGIIALATAVTEHWLRRPSLALCC